MPTYDYECFACGHSFELFQSMKAPVKRKCPECGRPRLQRLIGKGAAVMFKGSGFYETDYKRAGGGAKKPGDAEKKTDDAEKKTEKTESTPKATTPSGKDGD